MPHLVISYTKIANVISADFRIIGQLKGGDRVRFVRVSIEDAQEALLTEREALTALRTMTGSAYVKERKPRQPKA